MITFEKSAGVVVYREENGKNLYLLLKYRNGHWDFIKGHTEKGESLKETMRREAKEETGIDDLEIIGDFKNNIYYFYRAKGNEREERKRDRRKINIFKKVIYFLAKSGTSNVVLSHEHLDYAWLDYEDALEKVTFNNTRKTLSTANAYLKKHSQ